MKLRKTLRGAALIAALLMCLWACENGDPAADLFREVKSMQKTVVQCEKNPDGQWRLMVAEENELDFLNCSTVDETAGALTPGAVVEIAGVTVIQQTHPGRLIGEAISVTVLEPGQDFIGLYLDILDALYDEEAELNPQGSPDFSITYALDLTEVHNLSKEEKRGLVYLFYCSHDTDWEMGVQPAGACLATLQELTERGEIDEKTHRFEQGILFTIRDEPVQGESFSFSAKKWRSESETVSHDHCTARKDGDSWTFDGLT